MQELIRANWLILTPIMILSVVALAIIIERIVFFYRIRPRGSVVLTDLLPHIGTQTVQQIMNRFHKSDGSPAKELLHAALTSRLKGLPGIYKQRLEALRDRYLDRMERNMAILPGIANVATLMGLFGTVSGMITTFSLMNESGNSDPYVLAGGISRALVTTAAGLAVAIPTLLAHHLMEAVVDRHAEQMNEVVTDCISRFGAAYARQRNT